MGELSLSCTWPGFNAGYTQFIAVLDKSGSMSGNPFKQVRSPRCSLLMEAARAMGAVHVLLDHHAPGCCLFNGLTQPLFPTHTRLRCR